MTRSEKGAIAVSGAERASVPAEPIERLVDTTGAGDLFAAGFLAGQARGLGLEASLKLGAIAAAEVIQHYGARPEEDLKALAGVCWVRSSSPAKSGTKRVAARSCRTALLRRGSNEGRPGYPDRPSCLARAIMRSSIARDMRGEIVDLTFMNLDPALAEVAVAAAVAEVDQAADRGPHRQHQHRQRRQVEEQEQAAEDRQRADDRSAPGP